MLARTLAIVIAILVLVTGLVVADVFLPSIRNVLSEKGTLVVKLTDAPVELKHLNVTMSGLSALRVEYVFGLPRREAWEDLWFADGVSEVYVDILELRNVTKDLSVTRIPPGRYTKLRIAITKANATLADGETLDLVVPSTRIDAIIDFEVKAGETTTILLDMQADWAAISQTGRLRPVLNATVMPG
ncbi:MAG: DUF4382 domain-containing protein [Candidatus Bathyarchaeia archaeon]